MGQAVSVLVKRMLTHNDHNRTLKAGDKVSYQGNDILTLDKCTGKISGIIIAQDFLNFFWQLGVHLLPL